MAPIHLTGATSLINKNDNNRNKMIFQHILEDVFQQHQPPPPLTSPLIEIKRRFEWTLIAQQKHLPIKITNLPSSLIRNKTASIATLINLSLSSSSSHGHRPLLKSPSSSSNWSSGFLTMIPTSIHYHNDFINCLNDGFFLMGGDDKYLFGVNMLCLKFCAGRLTITMSRRDSRTNWLNSQFFFVAVTLDGFCDDDYGFTLDSINVKADWVGVHRQLLSLPGLSSTVKKIKMDTPHLVSWQKRHGNDDDYSIFIRQDPFHPDQYRVTDFNSPCHVDADSFILSPSISSSSTSSSWTSCNFLSPPGSPLLNATTSLPVYNNDDEPEEYDESINTSLVTLIQETLQYIHSSPSHHSYSTELESLVPKMGNFLSNSL
ncbi:unnamed protein product [Absidia cylindrospora]